ncbi:DHA2 family efflux MFS transporter permease subunit [Ktedonosporobacter rubrisoli]|uniref:DHA2 family efflux MFS transporter permease subunit n=1 Tax=Ktedonosporobacter rubrisoli TaxID=2509675 RepID=A0A4P6JM19_KTERU|nr:MFS transporter [Ktedonosporobacter rubrisoli]QBD76274.1 DHA2 family efflux MFS transporter permease subunit [Ktedonosporobacter rubrisoli]
MSVSEQAVIIPDEPVKLDKPVNSRRWLMLATVLLATFMSALDVNIVNVAVPSIESNLRANFAEIQLVTAGYTLAYAVFLTTGGRLGDQFGRKRIFMIGIVGFTLASALCGIAPNITLLIIFRVLQGALGALMVPQVIAIIQITFSPAERGIALGFYSSMIGLATMMGQLIGGVLIAWNILGLDWRTIFLVNVPIGIIATLASIPLVSESRVPGAHKLDLKGVVLLSLALFLLVFPLTEGSETGWPLWTYLSVGLSLIFFVIFGRYEQRLSSRGGFPLVSFSLFRSRSFMAGIFTNSLNLGLYAPVLLTLAFYLQSSLRFSPLQSGLVVTVMGLSFMVTSGFSPKITKLLGNKTLRVATIIITLGYLATLLATQLLVPKDGIWSLLVALFIIGIGAGVLFAPLMNRALEEIESDVVGLASGVYSTAQQVANALGVAVIGSVFASALGSENNYAHAFVISLLVVTIVSLGMWLSVTFFPRKSMNTPISVHLTE